MDWLIATGAMSLGILVGALVGWFVSEAEKWDQKALSAAVTILGGSGVPLLLNAFANPMPREVWLYPSGALLGFVIATVVELVYYDYYGNKRSFKRSENPD